MEIKQLEIRDEATCISALAIAISGNDGYLMRRAGYGSQCIFLVHLSAKTGTYDPYAWQDGRTMGVAHRHIIENWNSIQNEDVIDVQFILQETKAIAVSERFYTFETGK